MSRSWMIVFAIVLGWGTLTNAQFGQIENLTKKAIKKTVEKDDKQAAEDQKTDASKAEEKTAGQGERGARPKARKDADRKFAPGLSFSTVLNGVKMQPKTGDFRLHHIQATFLPENCEGGFIVLRTAEHKELCQWDWTPDNFATKKPYTLLSINKTTDLRTGESISGGSISLTEPGQYVLDFYLPDELFYTFPFSVEKIAGDDPFSGGDAYVLNGDWEKCGYLFYSEANAERSLAWKIWIRHKAIEKLQAKVQIEIKRDADGALVCTNRPDTNYTFTNEWVRYEFDMIFPPQETSAGAYFKAKDLLATDGDYTLIRQRYYGSSFWVSPSDGFPGDDFGSALSWTNYQET
ncbi:MAG: hypothetical protein GXY44_02835 [Phycisphaerales bacterium]|nr:hypothetical protein [Phycisphaerales bacterium]